MTTKTPLLVPTIQDRFIRYMAEGHALYTEQRDANARQERYIKKLQLAIEGEGYRILLDMTDAGEMVPVLEKRTEWEEARDGKGDL